MKFIQSVLFKKGGVIIKSMIKPVKPDTSNKTNKQKQKKKIRFFVTTSFFHNYVNFRLY